VKHPKPIIHGRDHEHGGADPTHIVYEDVGTSGGGGGSGGEPFGVGQRKSFTAAANTTTQLAPFDNFDASDDTVYQKDATTGAMRILKTGLYRVEAWLTMYALPANIPLATAPSLSVNTGGIAAPNSVISLPAGRNSYVNGRATGPGTGLWDPYAVTYLNVGAAPYLISTSLIGNGSTANSWNVDWAILAATRLADYTAALDLSPFGT
jgi:hypothetical protein